MRRVAVINLVGLTSQLLDTTAMPRLKSFGAAGDMRLIKPVFPAVTSTAQSTYLTGCWPATHGVVGNGWYNRELAEVQFWKQSNHLVQAPKVWETLKKEHPDFTCAKLFWWHNMYSTADWSITPRPLYPADGRKVFDIHSWPYDIRPAIKKDLGDFPFATFWGPAAGIASPQGSADAASRWIAESAKWIENKYHPSLNLIYLPHLDYNLQRLGPDHPAIAEDLKLVDQIAGDLLAFFAKQDVTVLVLSEYGITPVQYPIHLNRLFRERGWLAIKDELGLEILDAGASRVFAVADHQVAHIYLNDPALRIPVRRLLESTTGVAQILDDADKDRLHVNHPRAGELIAVAAEDSWFTYYYWMADDKAPDFARTVDIHRKPGYDPAELFLDPEIPAVKLKILWRLLQKKTGFRMLMDVIPLDASLVRGSHGIASQNPKNWPVIIGSKTTLPTQAQLEPTSVHEVIQSVLIGE